MKHIYKKIYLTAALVLLCSFAAWSQQQSISLTWQAEAGVEKKLNIRATAGTNNISVDWGDGAVENYSGLGSYNDVLLIHSYSAEGNYDVTVSTELGSDLTDLYCSDNQLTALDVSKNTELGWLSCFSNQLTALDVSTNSALTILNCGNNQLTNLDLNNNTALTSLYCYDNRLTSLDISANTALTSLSCYNNAIPLADLYAASQQIGNVLNKALGIQNLSERIALGTSVYLAPTTLGGVNTDFVVSRYGVPAIAGVDYTINGGSIVFRTDGVYKVEMTNAAIISHPNHPVKVVATYTAGYVPNQQIALTWQTEFSVEKTITIRATSGTNNITVDWGDGTIENYSGLGTDGYAEFVNLIHNYENTGTYNVNISTEFGTDLIYFDASGYELSSLDISNAYTLTGLSCNWNQLTSLDISKNTVLEGLFCYNNPLTILDISNNTALITLQCNGNQLKVLDVSKNTALEYLSCSSNQLTSLDVSTNTALWNLYCYSNQLSTLDVSANTTLTRLSCYNNAIPLADLYVASQQVVDIDYKYLGDQTLPAEKIDLGVSAYLAPATLGGVSTAFVVSKHGGTAVAGVDYMLSGGSIVFHTDGVYTIEMSNAAITSHPDYPVMVAATYVAGDVPPQQIALNWQAYANAEKSITVCATAGTDNVTVDWGDGSVDAYNGLGTNYNYVSLTHSYTTEGNYDVIVSTEFGTDLTYLNCSNSRLTNLDVSDAYALTYLNCSNNPLTALDVSKNTALTSLSCYDNQLTALDVSKNTALIGLDCRGNQLTTLDVSKNTALTTLSCGGNQLTTLDISTNTDLDNLHCGSNQLTALDVSTNTALTELFCYDNAIPLADLYAASQQIDNADYSYLGTQNLPAERVDLNTSIYLAPATLGGINTEFIVSKSGGVPAVVGIDYTLSGGSIVFRTDGFYKVEMINAAIESHPDYPAVVVATYVAGDAPPQQIALTWQAEAGVEKGFSIWATLGTDNIIVDWGDGNVDTYNGQGTNYNYVSLTHSYINEGNYDVIVSTEFGTDLTWFEANYRQILSLDVSDAYALTSFTCYNNQLTTLDVSANTALTNLECSSNQLTVLDVSKNTALTWLGCGHNQLTSLDVSANTALTSLNCNSNLLTTLDVSKNTTLSSLSCSSNQLTTLDVSANTALTNLVCSNNQLTSLDVSTNTALTSLGCYGNQLTALDVSTNMGLTELYCNNNQLTTLDVSKNTALTGLYCNNNQLSTLDVSKNTVLENLDCYDNRIPLSGLYAISQQVGNIEIESKHLGKQQPVLFEVQQVALNGFIDLSDQSSFGGMSTIFTVKKSDNSLALEGTDYSIANGRITFLSEGIYRVEMTNKAIVSSAYHPAIAITGVIGIGESTYTLTAESGAGGSISPSGTMLVNKGSSQTFYFYPDQDYKIESVLVDGINNAEAVEQGYYTFENITQNHSISVIFKSIAGIDDFENQMLLKLYPNPTSGELRIGNYDTSTALGTGLRIGETLIMYDLQGRKLLETDKTQIDISGYPAGVYVLDVAGKRARIIKN